MLTARGAAATGVVFAIAITVSACTSRDGPDPEESTGVIGVEIGRGPTDTRSPDDGPEPPAEHGGDPAQSPDESPSAPAGTPDREILIGTGEEASEVPTDAPAGMTEQEWQAAWLEASGAARTYLVERYSMSYTDEDPDQWLTRSLPLSTPAWQAALRSIVAVSGGMAGEWDEVVEAEMSYVTQTLNPPALDHTRPFGADQMTIFLAYRTWEISAYTGTQMPSGWDLYENDLGAPGSTFTAIELEQVDGAWLVASEGEVPVTGLGD